jgi:hypothetical protein
MAWIESDCELATHPKTLDLMNLTQEDIVTTLGRLHLLWHFAMKYADNGDLRKFNNAQIGRAVGLNGDRCKDWVEAMVKSSWIDREPYFRIHDWWNHAGRFLQGKYGRNPKEWKKIKRMYVGNSVCKQFANNIRNTDTTKHNITEHNKTIQNKTKDVDLPKVSIETGVDVEVKDNIISQSQHKSLSLESQKSTSQRPDFIGKEKENKQKIEALVSKLSRTKGIEV